MDQKREKKLGDFTYLFDLFLQPLTVYIRRSALY